MKLDDEYGKEKLNTATSIIERARQYVQRVKEERANALIEDIDTFLETVDKQYDPSKF